PAPLYAVGAMGGPPVSSHDRVVARRAFCAAWHPCPPPGRSMTKGLPAMLRNWKWPHWSRRKARPAASPAIGDETPEALPGAAVSGGWETVTLLVDLDPQQTPLSLEVDEGVTVPVLLNEQNAGMIVESIQLVR